MKTNTPFSVLLAQAEYLLRQQGKGPLNLCTLDRQQGPVEIPVNSAWWPDDWQPPEIELPDPFPGTLAPAPRVKQIDIYEGNKGDIVAHGLYRIMQKVLGEGREFILFVDCVAFDSEGERDDLVRLLPYVDGDGNPDYDLAVLDKPNDGVAWTGTLYIYGYVGLQQEPMIE